MCTILRVPALPLRGLRPLRAETPLVREPGDLPSIVGARLSLLPASLSASRILGCWGRGDRKGSLSGLRKQNVSATREFAMAHVVFAL